MRSRFLVGGPLMSIGSSAKYTSPLGATHRAVGASMSGAWRTISHLKPSGTFGNGSSAKSGRDEREEAGGREERGQAGCHGEPFQQQAGPTATSDTITDGRAEGQGRGEAPGQARRKG